jgi:hypothetical protein
VIFGSPFVVSNQLGSPYGLNNLTRYLKNHKASKVTMLEAYSNSLNQWHGFSKKRKSKPLEKVLGKLCDYIKKEYGHPYEDLTENNNFKNNPNMHHSCDYAVWFLGAIEGKNLDCPSGNHGEGYYLSESSVDEGIISRFTAYDNDDFPLHIAVIARPIYGEGAKMHLLSNGVIVVELGYVVTENELVMAHALNDLKRMFVNLLRELGIEKLISTQEKDAVISKAKEIVSLSFGYFNTIHTRISNTVNLTSLATITRIISSNVISLGLRSSLFKVKSSVKTRLSVPNLHKFRIEAVSALNHLNEKLSVTKHFGKVATIQCYLLSSLSFFQQVFS